MAFRALNGSLITVHDPPPVPPSLPPPVPSVVCLVGRAFHMPSLLHSHVVQARSATQTYSTPQSLSMEIPTQSKLHT